METQNESVEVDSGIEFSGVTEYASCEKCGTYKDADKECLCCIEDREHHIQQESAERLRYLMSLGHPGEHGEPYNRWQTMEECQRRGKQLFLDLGWPVEPNSIYKNKYTGTEETLECELRHLVMERDRNKPYDEMFSIHGWSVIEHAWPKELWNDSQVSEGYKNKLSYFKDMDVDEEVQEYEDEDAVDEDYEAPQKPKKVIDKTQVGLSGWF